MHPRIAPSLTLRADLIEHSKQRDFLFIYDRSTYTNESNTGLFSAQQSDEELELRIKCERAVDCLDLSSGRCGASVAGRARRYTCSTENGSKLRDRHDLAERVASRETNSSRYRRARLRAWCSRDKLRDSKKGKSGESLRKHVVAFH